MSGVSRVSGLENVFGEFGPVPHGDYLSERLSVCGGRRGAESPVLGLEIVT